VAQLRRRQTATARTSQAANDKGPVGIITEDPDVCRMESNGERLSPRSKRSNGATATQTIPASAWTPEQRKMYESVGNAMRSVADQAVDLAKKTPHRVMRELYEQYIAYARRFAETVPKYRADDAPLAAVVDDLASVFSKTYAPQ